MEDRSTPSVDTLNRIRVQQSSRQALEALSSLGDVGLLGAVLAGVPDGIVITTASSEILWANPAYCAMTGYRLEELMGVTPRTVRGGSASPASAEAIWDGLASCGCFDGRVTNRRADGTPYHASLSIVRLPGSEERAAHFLGIMRDVTADVLMEERLSDLRERADSARNTTIAALASLAEQRDDCTGGHLLRVEAYCRAMATWLLSRAPDRFPIWARDPDLLARCSVLHDIGKVGIPDAILLKPGSLDPPEQEIMRSHPEIGGRIIERLLALQPDSEFLRVARDVVLCHHERFDGEGYPRGLAGADVPMVAQLTTAADVLDALTTRRPYKPAHRFGDAVAWLVAQRGRMLDPLVVDALVGSLPELTVIHARLALDEPSDEAIRPSGLRRSEPARPPAPHELPAPDGATGESLLETLAAAEAALRTGFFTMRHGAMTSHLYLEGGLVVWIQTDAEQNPLQRVLIEEHGVPAHLVREAADSCKLTGEPLGDALLRMAALDVDALRAVLGAHLGEKLRTIEKLPPATVAFVPRSPGTSSRFRFALEDLLAATAP